DRPDGGCTMVPKLAESPFTRSKSRRDAVRLRRALALALGFLLAPGVAYAQTEVIEREVEAKLWIQRFFEGIGAATGTPPLVPVLALTALLLALAAAFWLWRARERRTNAAGGGTSKTTPLGQAGPD